MSYQPSYKITEDISTLIIEIGELVGSISANRVMIANPKLRRENRIKTIYSSLAIEQNTLTLEQVTDVIKGKRVLAPPQDIKEVKNANELYEKMSNLDPYSVEHLLFAHKILMENLNNEAGRFRMKGAGVFAGEELIHSGTPPQYIPELISQLFQWLKESKVHPLIKSCIFHYELEYIHPFADGNGRLGRFWHTLLLSKWKNFFAWLPIESLIHNQQQDYYYALNESNKDGESTTFILFMLKIIRDSLLELPEISKIMTDKMTDKDSERWEIIKKYLNENGDIKNIEVRKILDVSDSTAKRYMKKIVELGLVNYSGENKERRYFLINNLK